MYSTHSTNFTGLHMGVNKQFSKLFTAGMGAGYSYCVLHGDNGFDLHHLNFIPLYASQNFTLARVKKFSAFINLKEGVTFKSYYRELQSNRGPRSHIRERGFYGYAGAGLCYSIMPQSAIVLQLGMKSYHISTNELEINPHGIGASIGYLQGFSFKKSNRK